MEPVSSANQPSSGVGLASPRLRLTKRVGMIAGAAVALLASSYGVGRAQGAHEVSRVEATARAAQARMDGSARNLRSQVERLEGEVGRARHATALVEGRRQLGLALLALDERNFGIAQGQIDAARAALRDVGGADDPGLGEVARSLAGLNVIAAGDFADQRARVLAIVRAFDLHLPAAASR